MGWFVKLTMACGLLFFLSRGTFGAATVDYSGLGNAVTSNSEILGTWDLVGFSIQDRPNEQIHFSGKASIRFRADGVMFSEFAQHSSGFSDGMLYGSCTGYDSGMFSASKGIINRTNVVVAGITGNCYDVRISPGAKKIENQTITAFLKGTTLTLISEATISEHRVAKKIIITRSFNRIAQETWDGSGVDPSLIGTYNISGMYTDATCKRTELSGMNGALAFQGSWQFVARENAYTAIFDRFAVVGLQACSAITKGLIEEGALSAKWSQLSSSHTCASGEMQSGEVTDFDRDIMGMPSRGYVKITAMSFPDKDCDDGYSHILLISVFGRQ